MTTDISGRAYAKYSELKAGDFVEVDAGFDCLTPGRHEVKSDGSDLYLECKHGAHYLTMEKDKGYLIGVYLVDRTAPPEASNG
jgi:hypothetical protein